MLRYLPQILSIITSVLISSNVLAVYNADLGRWISRDPVGYADSASLYGYTPSNPLRASDPLGLSCTGTSSCQTQPENTPPALPDIFEPDDWPDDDWPAFPFGYGRFGVQAARDECENACSTPAEDGTLPAGVTVCVNGIPVACVCLDNINTWAPANGITDPGLLEAFKRCVLKHERRHREHDVDCTHCPDGTDGTCFGPMIWKDGLNSNCAECVAYGITIKCLKEHPCNGVAECEAQKKKLIEWQCKKYKEFCLACPVMPYFGHYVHPMDSDLCKETEGDGKIHLDFFGPPD